MGKAFTCLPSQKSSSLQTAHRHSLHSVPPDNRDQIEMTQAAQQAGHACYLTSTAIIDAAEKCPAHQGGMWHATSDL
jgi:hypothetical protein